MALEDVTVSEGSDLMLDKVKGDLVELQIKFETSLSNEFGINMLGDENGSEELNISNNTGVDKRSIL